MTTVRKVRNRLKKLLPNHHSAFVIRKCLSDESRVEIFVNFTSLMTVNDTKSVKQTIKQIIYNINQFVPQRAEEILNELE